MRPGLNGPMAYQAGPAYSRYGTVPPSYMAQDPNYGAFVPLEKGSMLQSRLRRSSISEIIMSIVLPWGIFAANYSLVTLPIHYTGAKIMVVSLALLLVLVLSLGGGALMSYRKYGFDTEAKWYTFIFVTSALAWCLGILIGQENYATNMVPYLDIMNLNTYLNVYPNTTHGQLLMDAGVMRFAAGTMLHLNKTVGFRNVDYYCVAPVTTNASIYQQTEFDFWAVGVNCCSGRTGFTCGDVSPLNPLESMSGLRLMREDQRGFFRLAVEQAEAAYGIRARHAIFLHWMRDPLIEIDAYHASGYQYLIIGFLAYVGFQIAATTAAACVIGQRSA